MSNELVPVPREARPYQGLPAGIVSRILAAVVDGVVITVLVIAGYLGIAGIQFLWKPLRFEFPTLTMSTFLLIGAIIAIAYFTFTWSGNRRTYGDHVLGLRVVADHGEWLRPWRSFLRAVCTVLFPLGLAWALISKESHSVQDIIFRTSVIYDWRETHDVNYHKSHDH